MILETTARLLLPVFLIFSVFLLLRGHDLPGGGFTGGLVASAGIALYMLAYGPRAVRRMLQVDLKPLIGAGLGVALLSTLFGVFGGKSFFTGVWGSFAIGSHKVKIGTPFFFDLGVYFVVVGVAMTVLLARMED